MAIRTAGNVNNFADFVIKCEQLNLREKCGKNFWKNLRERKRKGCPGNLLSGVQFLIDGLTDGIDFNDIFSDMAFYFVELEEEDRSLLTKAVSAQLE